MTVHAAERRADVEICWEGGARTELDASGSTAAAPRRAGCPRTRSSSSAASPPITPTARSPRSSPAKAAAPAPGCRSPKRRVKAARQRAGIPAAPPPDPGSRRSRSTQAADRARRLGRSRSAAGCATACCPASRPRPRAPWRIRLTDDIRARFVPDIPDGYLAARRRRHGARLRPPDRVAQGPTRRTARHPRHPRPPQRARNRGSRRPA